MRSGSRREPRTRAPAGIDPDRTVRPCSLAAVAHGPRVANSRCTTGRDQTGAVTVVGPVLNEAQRLAPCLDGLLGQGPEVGEILIVDGGSTDGTRDLVRAYARRDRRMRLVEAGPAPDDWNGKVWGLDVGERALSWSAAWLLTLDADVRPSPALARSLVARAQRRHLRLLSVATAHRESRSV